MSKKAVHIFWFRRDLRWDDNAGLYYSLREELPVVPIFIFDRHILDDLEEKADPRVGFIRDRVNDLNRELHQSKSAGIECFYSTPKEAFHSLMDKYQVQGVYTNRDYEPYAKERDKEIGELLREKGIGFYTFKDQVIFERNEVLTGGGDFYKVFTPYKNQWLKSVNINQLDTYTSGLKFSNFLENGKQKVPTLEEMGFAKSDISIPSDHIPTKTIEKYDQLRNFPAIEGTSRLGIHFRHGTVSIRKVAKEAAALNEAWLNELIWREFYMMILDHNPQVVDTSFKKEYDNIEWRNDVEQFEKWCNGLTGYPIVDAGMRQLNQTGYMHNRVRMITASFLTKHLLIDWRWGEAYFAKKLLDYELSSNNGGWQWAAGSGTDAQPYFRIFNPYTQTDKFDKDRKYIREYVPEVDTDTYPDPIVEHKFARERALDTFKKGLGKV